MDSDFLTFKNVIENASVEKDTFARFYDRSVKTNEINPKTGVPIYKDVCYVEIRIKNNNTDIYDQPASEEKKARFPAEYRQYLQEKETRPSGTALENFSFLTASQINTLKFYHIDTLEKLSALTAEQASDLDIVNEYHAAQNFLAGAKKQFEVAKWQEKVTLLNQKIQELEAALKSAQQQKRPLKNTHKRSIRKKTTRLKKGNI